MRGLNMTRKQTPCAGGAAGGGLTRSMLFSSFWISERSSLSVFSLPCWRANDDAHAECSPFIQFSSSICDGACARQHTTLSNVSAESFVNSTMEKSFGFIFRTA